jgi:hypothetical protein
VIERPSRREHAAPRGARTHKERGGALAWGRPTSAARRGAMLAVAGSCAATDTVLAKRSDSDTEGAEIATGTAQLPMHVQW